MIAGYMCDWLHKKNSETKWGQANSEGTLEEFRYETYHVLRINGYNESIANAFIKIAPILSESAFYFDMNKIDDIIKGQVEFKDLQEEVEYKPVINSIVDAARGLIGNDFDDLIYLLKNDENMQPVLEEKSQSELYDEIMVEKYEYYRDEVIRNLETTDKTLSPDDLKLDSLWEEFCYQIQNGESYDWALYEDHIRQLCKYEIDDVPISEIKLLWLETDAYIYCCGYEDDEYLTPTFDTMVEDVGEKIYQEVYNAAEDYELADKDQEEDDDDYDDEEDENEDDGDEDSAEKL